MQRKFHFGVKDKATASANNTYNGSTAFTCGSQFSRKSVGSAFSCVLGNNTTFGKHASKVKKKVSLGDSGNVNGRTTSNELGNNLGSTLSQLLTLEEPDGGGGEGKDRQRVKINLPLLRFLHKKKGWNNFIRARLRRKAKFSNNVHGDRDTMVIRFRQIRRKASLRYLVKIPSKLLVIRLKLKMMKSLIKKKVTKQCEHGVDDGNEDRELCKKRILMGGRCRPLSSPCYYTHGLFSPRDSSLTRAPRQP